jgi:hypothetical protein
MLCYNELIHNKRIEGYCKGELPASAGDYAEAIIKGCSYICGNFAVYQFIENEVGTVHAKEVRRGWNVKFNMGKDCMQRRLRSALLKDFGGVCATIQDILFNVEKIGSQQVKADLLKGRPAQNRPTEYILTNFKDVLACCPADASN